MFQMLLRAKPTSVTESLEQDAITSYWRFAADLHLKRKQASEKKKVVSSSK